MSSNKLLHVVKLNEGGEVNWNFDEMLKLNGKTTFTYDNLLSKSSSKGSVVGHFGKKKEIVKKINERLAGQREKGSINGQGIYIYVENSYYDGSYNRTWPVYAILNDCHFTKDNMKFTAAFILRIMAQFCTKITFHLSPTECNTLTQVNQMYSKGSTGFNQLTERLESERINLKLMKEVKIPTTTESTSLSLVSGFSSISVCESSAISATIEASPAKKRRVKREIGTTTQEVSILSFTEELITFNVSTNVVNRWIFRVSDKTMLVVLALENSTLIQLKELANPDVPVSTTSLEYPIKHCVYSSTQKTLALTCSNAVLVYKVEDSCELARNINISSVFCTCICQDGQILMALPNKQWQITTAAEEFRSIAVPCDFDCNSAQMMCDDEILGSLVVRDKYLELKTFKLEGEKSLGTLKLDLSIENFEYAVSGSDLHILDLDQKKLYSYRVKHTKFDTTTVFESADKDEVLELTWVYLVRMAIQNQTHAYFLSTNANHGAFGQYMKHIKMSMGTDSRTIISTGEIVQILLGAIPVPLKSLRGVHETGIGKLVSQIDRPCFVLGVISTFKESQAILECLTTTKLIRMHTSKAPWVYIQPEADLLFVIMDCNVNGEQDELKALALCANVANYTITTDSASFSLLEKIPASSFLPRRTNSGPLGCFTSKAPSGNTSCTTSGSAAIVSNYFNGHIENFMHSNPNELGQRLILQCRNRASDPQSCYRNGSSFIHCLNQALC